MKDASFNSMTMVDWVSGTRLGPSLWTLPSAAAAWARCGKLTSTREARDTIPAARAGALHASGRDANAELHARRVLVIDPDYGIAPWYLAIVLASAGPDWPAIAQKMHPHA